MANVHIDPPTSSSSAAYAIVHGGTGAMSETSRPPDPVESVGGAHEPANTDVAARPRAWAAERALVEKLLAGDEAAYADLVHRHHGALLRLAMVFVSSRGVAEEVVQETWLGVLEGLPSFEGRSSLKSWIFRILTNRAQTRGAREGRSVPFSALGDAGSEPEVDPARFQPNGKWAAAPRRWDGDTPERLARNREALDRLQRALEELPPQQRAVVTLRDIDGLDTPEICNVLQISETNQRVLLHRARSTLRRLLEEFVDGV